MRLDRKGVTRLVIVSKKVVVKIPNFTCQWEHFLKGVVANIHENKTWKYNSGEYEKGHSRLLCPVVWCSIGGWILIMRKVDKVFGWEDVNDISEHIAQFPGDDKITNYGMLNGKVVKFDYGQS